MDAILRFPSAMTRDPRIEDWFSAPDRELRRITQPWFEQMRACGPDVRELLQDGHPTACLGDAPFGYVDAFSAHANIGFFYGAFLQDPTSLLEGAGKRMRHVKLRWAQTYDARALTDLIAQAYRDVRHRAQAPQA